jgi:acetyltransferase-like isoleucine patch superfamily enzyme
MLLIRPIRKTLKWLLGLMGILQRIEDGRLVPYPSVFITNFLFQRIMGVNGNCPWAVHYTSRVVHPNRIRIGRRVAVSLAVNTGMYIHGANGIVIGDDVLLGPGVKIISINHDPLNHACYVSAPPIRIGDRCWIGADAVILPGVTLGEGVVVGAGAVVTRSCPAKVIIAGNPAKIIRRLEDSEFPRQVLSEHVKARSL